MTLFDEVNEYAENLREKGYNIQIAHYEDGLEEVITITVIIDKKRNRAKYYG